MPEVICLGELLIDFIASQKDIPLGESPAFEKAPGGAPANVAVGLAKLGVQAGFVGKVGDEHFGRYLKKTLQQNKVDTSYLILDKQTRTTLAFVSRFSHGQNEFTFYRHPGADMMLKPSEIKERYFRRARIFHFGSISLGSQPSCSATLKALKLARKHKLLISYDPNLRLSLWDSPQAARKAIWLGLKHADVVKISDQEWKFITGTNNLDQGCRKLFKLGIKLVVVSLGPKGCYYNNGCVSGYVKGFKVKDIDTTGAGDAFMASILAAIMKQPSHRGKLSLTRLKLKDMLKFANAAGAITTRKIGVILSLPRRREVDQFLRTKV